MVYEPAEDSYLLLEQVKRHSHGKVLEIGTGTGIQAIEASKKADVTAVDVDEDALSAAKENAKKENAKIKFIKSDLFQNVKGKYDLIIFNAPYLPEDRRFPDLALDGGKKGYEILQRFIENANDYLLTDGKMLIVFSSKTHKDKVEEIIKQNLFEYREEAKKTVFFEDIYVDLIWKSGMLKEFDKLKLHRIRYLAKGKRSKVYRCDKGVIKIEDTTSGAMSRITNEAKWLKKLNKKGIGPKLITAKSNFIVMEYIEGKRIDEFFEEEKDKKKIIDVIIDILNQCHTMDLMNASKEEMHSPFKHIIVDKKPAMIDFERCHSDISPKNVTQFMTYLATDWLNNILRKRGITIEKEEIIELSKEYKKSKSLERITKHLKTQILK
jgi:release factor glutamine methyltransferase